MRLIVAVDKNWGIGKDNDLLFCLKEDMKHFVAHTTNKVVVMGYNTLLSLPLSKPLKNRINIVLGGSSPINNEYIHAKNLDELFAIIANYNSDDVFVIGGAMTYKTLLQYCDTAYVTRVNANGNATVFFENLDNNLSWQLKEKSPKTIDNGYEIEFCTYINKKL